MRMWWGRVAIRIQGVWASSPNKIAARFGKLWNWWTFGTCATAILRRSVTDSAKGVLLARAICQEPQIIVLDEPTSFLDVRYQLELLCILRNLAKARDIAVIMSLHELDLAQKISDIVVCVKGEHIAHYGTPQEIFRREIIHPLYDLSNGSYNPLFGSVEMGRPQGEPYIFVIAGWWHGHRDLPRAAKTGGCRL